MQLHTFPVKQLCDQLDSKEKDESWGKLSREEGESQGKLPNCYISIRSSTWRDWGRVFGRYRTYWFDLIAISLQKPAIIS